LDLLSLVCHVRLVCSQFQSLCFQRRDTLNVRCWERFNWGYHEKASLNKNSRGLMVLKLVALKCKESNSDSQGHFKRLILDRSFGLARCLRNSTMFHELFDLVGNDLELLSFRGCVQINDATLQLIAQCDFAANRLRSLHLSGNRTITDEGIRTISNHCFELREIYLRGLYRLTHVSLKSLLTHLRHKLERLDLHGMKSDMKFSDVIQFTNLTHLNVQDASFLGTDIEDALGSVTIGQCFSNLRVLNLMGLNSVTDQTVKVLFDHCVNLRHFEIQNNTMITDVSCTYVKGLVVLNMISCPGITSQGIIALANNNPDFERLEFKALKQIEEESILYLLDNCSQLHTLNLAQTNMSNRVLEDAQQRKQMKLINLTLCTGMVPESLATVHRLNTEV